MLKTATSKQIQMLDDFAIHKLGIPSLVLMENAGRIVAEETIQYLKRKKHSSVCVVCGCGNNAGDGLVAARYLMNAGIHAKIILLTRPAVLKSDPLTNYSILKRIGASVLMRRDWKSSDSAMLKNADVLIDAIFGVGLNREVQGVFKDAIGAINLYGKYVIAVDIPSGLDATTGNIYGCAVQADQTITFTYAKKGFYHNEGPKYVGKIKVVDIGIPPKAKKKVLSL